MEETARSSLAKRPQVAVSPWRRSSFPAVFPADAGPGRFSSCFAALPWKTGPGRRTESASKRLLVRDGCRGGVVMVGVTGTGADAPRRGFPPPAPAARGARRLVERLAAPRARSRASGSARVSIKPTGRTAGRRSCHAGAQRRGPRSVRAGSACGIARISNRSRVGLRAPPRSARWRPGPRDPG